MLAKVRNEVNRTVYKNHRPSLIFSLFRIIFGFYGKIIKDFRIYSVMVYKCVQSIADASVFGRNDGELLKLKFF